MLWIIFFLVSILNFTMVIYGHYGQALILLGSADHGVTIVTNSNSECANENMTAEQIAAHNRKCMPEIAALMDVVRPAFGGRLLWAEENGYGIGRGYGAVAVRLKQRQT